MPECGAACPNSHDLAAIAVAVSAVRHNDADDGLPTAEYHIRQKYGAPGAVARTP